MRINHPYLALIFQTEIITRDKHENVDSFS